MNEFGREGLRPGWMKDRNGSGHPKGLSMPTAATSLPAARTMHESVAGLWMAWTLGAVPQSRTHMLVLRGRAARSMPRNFIVVLTPEGWERS